MVQTVNLTECGELVQDLVSDAKDYDSRLVIIIIMEIKNMHSWEKRDRRFLGKSPPWRASISLHFDIKLKNKNKTQMGKGGSQVFLTFLGSSVLKQ